MLHIISYNLRNTFLISKICQHNFQYHYVLTMMIYNLLPTESFVISCSKQHYGLVVKTWNWNYSMIQHIGGRNFGEFYKLQEDFLSIFFFSKSWWIETYLSYALKLNSIILLLILKFDSNSRWAVVSRGQGK